MLCHFACKLVARIAQSVEHQTFNLRVQGSSACSGGDASIFVLCQIWEVATNLVNIWGCALTYFRKRLQEPIGAYLTSLPFW